MPNNNSKAVGVRVKTEVIDRVMQRANRKGWTFNKWVNYALDQSLRPHRKRG